MKMEEINNNLQKDMVAFLKQCGDRGYDISHIANAFIIGAITLVMGGYVLSAEEKKKFHDMLDAHINRFEPLAKKVFD